MSSILVELQYLGPASYYASFVDFDEVYIEACEHYNKGSYRNRCRLLSSLGPIDLSIPLSKGKHQQSPIREVRIDNSTNWQRRHWRTIKSCYGSAPYFPFYEDMLAHWYEEREEFLWDFCLKLLKQSLQCLRIEKEPLFTESYQQTEELDAKVLDFREGVHPKKPKNHPSSQILSYPQVFEDRLGFVAPVSILDTLLCQGPQLPLQKLNV